jgi:hypothetical protein
VQLYTDITETSQYFYVLAFCCQQQEHGDCSNVLSERKDIIWDSRTTSNKKRQNRHYCVSICLYSFLVASLHVTTLSLGHLQAYMNTIQLLNCVINQYEFVLYLYADNYILILISIKIQYEYILIYVAIQKLNIIHVRLKMSKEKGRNM